MNLYRFYWDCGRQGNVEGLFLAEQEDINKLYGTNIYFGEILGKHSEIYGNLEEKDIEMLTSDQDFISRLVEYLKPIRNTISGYNPFNYIPEDSDYWETDEEDD